MPEVKELVDEGNELSRKKEWAQALERYRAAAALEPNDATLYFLIGSCHFKMDHGPGAREAWSRALEIDPTYEEARTWIHRLTGMSFETPTSAPG